MSEQAIIIAGTPHPTITTKMLETYVKETLLFSDVSEVHNPINVHALTGDELVELDFDGVDDGDNSIRLNVTIKHEQHADDIRPFVDVFAFRVDSVSDSRDKVAAIVKALIDAGLPTDRHEISELLANMEFEHLKEDAKSVVVVLERGEITEVLTDDPMNVRIVDLSDNPDEPERLNVDINGSILQSDYNPDFKQFVDNIDVDALLLAKEPVIEPLKKTTDA